MYRYFLDDLRFGFLPIHHGYIISFTANDTSPATLGYEYAAPGRSFETCMQISFRELLELCIVVFDSYPVVHFRTSKNEGSARYDCRQVYIWQTRTCGQFRDRPSQSMIRGRYEPKNLDRRRYAVCRFGRVELGKDERMVVSTCVGRVAAQNSRSRDVPDGPHLHMCL